MKLVLISVFFAVLFQFPSAANAICKRQEQFEQLQRVCQSIKNQCADVPEQQRLSCQPNIARDSWGILVGCAKGAFQSVKDFVLFLVHIGKALINTAVQTMRNPNGAVNATASLARSGALSASQLGNYVRREFEISKRKMGLLGRIPIASDFAASLEVARKIVGPVIKSIWGAIEGFAEQQVHNFGCYNPEARAHMLCKVATDIFFPPAGAIALLKGGAVLKNFPNLERAIQKLASLVGKDAKAVASTNRATKAETAVRVAAKPAARSGATEKVAKDMHETWRRTPLDLLDAE